MRPQPKWDKHSLLAKALSGLDMKRKHRSYLVQLKRVVSGLQKGISFGGCQGKVLNQQFGSLLLKPDPKCLNVSK
jgi:hypothetical protein